MIGQYPIIGGITTLLYPPALYMIESKERRTKRGARSVPWTGDSSYLIQIIKKTSEMDGVYGAVEPIAKIDDVNRCSSSTGGRETVPRPLLSIVIDPGLKAQ